MTGNVLGGNWILTLNNIMGKTATRDIDKESDYYWKRVGCANCDLEDSLAFHKGLTVSDHECPNCNCKTLFKKTL